ncbi:MAG: calcium-binding protein [Rhodobacteraceae bacterium]|nr:calcium-binding protein [Paracoccaceae bacterium]
MKRKTVLAAGLAAALVGAAAIPVYAHGQGQGAGGLGDGPGAMMGYGAQQGGPGMMGGNGPTNGNGSMGGGMMGNGMMGQMMAMTGGGFGPMGGPGVMGPLFQKFDTNGDGIVSPDELRTGLQAALKQYDKNGDGVLSLDEFSAFYTEVTRPAMVRHFQALDTDGDGKITATEMSAPADRMAQMQKLWQSQHGDGTAVPGPGMMNGNN